MNWQPPGRILRVAQPADSSDQPTQWANSKDQLWPTELTKINCQPERSEV
jgi:hypothetical protein